MPNHEHRDDIGLLDPSSISIPDPSSGCGTSARLLGPVGGRRPWGVTRYDDIMAIAKDPETFVRGKPRPERGNWIPSMINLDEPLHKRRRSIVNRGFTPRRVQDQEEKLRALTVSLIDDVIERGECDFVLDIARWIPMVAIGDMLGVEPEDRAHPRVERLDARRRRDGRREGRRGATREAADI